MRNPELGRKILDIIDTQPEKFQMSVFGAHRYDPAGEVCGTVACLAGWAMLLSGYELDKDDIFLRPDGTDVDSEDGEARELLGMSITDELSGYDGSVHDPHAKVWFDFFHGPDRFRKLVEKAEGEQR